MAGQPSSARASLLPPPGPVRLVARWDLDKTYLRTDFDTVRDLVRTALERPDRKRSVPGAAALLRELCRAGARIHILSGSPRQMRGPLEEKLRIDRVRWDELTLKPNLSNLARLRFRAMRDQLGYKLPALLAARARDQGNGESDAPCELLVGDDAEADAFVYSLYADLCEGRVDARQLRRILDRGKVYSDQRDACLSALLSIKRGPAVGRILIHLERQTPPSRFDGYGPRVVPFYNYLQAACVLAEDGWIEPQALLRVANELVLRHRFDADALARSYQELLRRGHLRGRLVSRLSEAVGQFRPESSQTVLHRMVELLGEGDLLAAEPASQPELDYIELASHHQGGKNRKRLRSR